MAQYVYTIDGLIVASTTTSGTLLIGYNAETGQTCYLVPPDSPQIMLSDLGQPYPTQVDGT